MTWNYTILLKSHDLTNITWTGTLTLFSSLTATRLLTTAQKESVFGVILVRIFPAFSRFRTEYGEIRSKNAGKMWTRMPSNTDTFYAVNCLANAVIVVIKLYHFSNSVYLKLMATSVSLKLVLIAIFFFFSIIICRPSAILVWHKLVNNSQSQLSLKVS